jgi:hypothetical protein
MNSYLNLHQALHSWGFTSRKTTDEQRREIFDRSGISMGQFDASEAWKFIEDGEQRYMYGNPLQSTPPDVFSRERERQAEIDDENVRADARDTA